jgi:hypothetical protein
MENEIEIETEATGDIQGVSEIHNTTLEACFMHKNNGKCLFKRGPWALHL